MVPLRVPSRLGSFEGSFKGSSKSLGFKGPCAQIAYTLAPKYPKSTTLRPKYILLGENEPSETRNAAASRLCLGVRVQAYGFKGLEGFRGFGQHGGQQVLRSNIDALMKEEGSGV